MPSPRAFWKRPVVLVCAALALAGLGVWVYFDTELSGGREEALVKEYLDAIADGDMERAGKVAEPAWGEPPLTEAIAPAAPWRFVRTISVSRNDSHHDSDIVVEVVAEADGEELTGEIYFGIGRVNGDLSGIIDPLAQMRITADPGRRITVSGAPVDEYGEGAGPTYVLPGVHSVSADGGPATWVLCGDVCQVDVS